MSDLSLAVIMSDTDGHINYWNDAAASLFGYTANESLGQSLDMILPDDFRDAHWNAFKRTMAEGVMRLDRAATNVPVRVASGEVIVFPARFTFLQGPRDEVAGVMAVFSPPEGGEEPFGEVTPRPA